MWELAIAGSLIAALGTLARQRGTEPALAVTIWAVGFGVLSLTAWPGAGPGTIPPPTSACGATRTRCRHLSWPPGRVNRIPSPGGPERPVRAAPGGASRAARSEDGTTPECPFPSDASERGRASGSVPGRMMGGPAQGVGSVPESLDAQGACPGCPADE